MLAHGNGGSIVNISSGAAWRGRGGMDVYTATKAAMEGVTRSMAGQYASARIRVNAIVLGLINNGGGVAHMLDNPEIAPLIRAEIPLPFVGEPDDIAWGAVYLASDEARYVTGVSLPIDGGALNAASGGSTTESGFAEPKP
jgi:NAD(P)-dependent dehydrogenase (short-subunit alcohol dehydrogenase family)